MKDKLNIPIPKQEDLDALNKRRETYASKRDLQASEFNLAITKRLQAEAIQMIKCDKCGKEFTPAAKSESLTCPDCLKK
jgi:protein-arginine kinase activator protein McsA